MKKRAKSKKPGKIGKIIKTVFSSLAIILLAVIVIAANTVLPTYGRMVTEVLGYRQGWKTPANSLDLQYNKPDFASVDELKAAEQALNEQIEAEGAVLLKHTEGYMPYASGTSFSLFSRSSAAYLSGGYLGGGVTLKSALESRGFSVNETLWKFYDKGTGSNYHRGTGSINYGAAEDFAINEVPIDVITGESGLTDTFGGTTAVFVLSRVVGEGRDMPRSMYNHTYGRCSNLHHADLACADIIHHFSKPGRLVSLPEKPLSGAYPLNL